MSKHSYDFRTGDHVQVIDGPNRGKTGTVLAKVGLVKTKYNIVVDNTGEMLYGVVSGHLTMVK